MISDRIRELRTALKLNQREFSQRAKIGHSTLAMFETGQRVPKDIHISQICQTFNANEEWLRTGNGEMFNRDEDADIAKLAREFSLSKFGQAAIIGYSHLSDVEKVAVGNYIKAVAKEYEKIEDSQRNEAKTEFRSKTDEIDPDIKKELDSYRQELEMEKSIRISSALPHSNGSAG